MRKTLPICVIVLFFFCYGALAQESKNLDSIKSEAKLIQSGPYQNSEVESLNIDVLRNQMREHPGSKGIIVIFCGKICQYGEIEAHLRGINLSLQGKGLDKEFVVLNGGFKDKFSVEYWVIPQNACLPIPNSTIKIEDVKFKGNYKRKFVPYDCCEY